MADFEDIRKFGENIGLKDEPELGLDAPFALLIEGIEHPQDRVLVENVCQESGLELDMEAIRLELAEGHVLITHMNEAKAAILVDRLKDIDAQIQLGYLEDILKQRSHKKEMRPVSSQPLVSASKAQAVSEEELSELSTLEKPFHVEAEGVILTTSPSLEQRSIKKYLGIVSAEVVISKQDLLATRSQYDAAMQKVLEKLTSRARSLNASAVIAISFHYEFIPDKKVFVIFVAGTAVEV
ncbi:MAG: heavy metal-binding domain-containing protein [Deltaproteobacteria bacterium]|nr:heavy metal-binding domain-containing protein [Deltaproteobacteria bacterium]